MDPFKIRYNDGDFNDDERIVLPQGRRPIIPGRVKLVIRSNDKAPLEENIQKVMLELTGGEESRSGLDLVVVSGSMRTENLHEFKIAMLYVMEKLSAVDRLSIVVYSIKAGRLCPLRQITESSKKELENLIKGLKYQIGTNITDGLEMALNILKDRSFSSGRAGAIMLVSDSEDNIGNAASVPVGNVPVHTFGFGIGHNPKLLKAITSNSRLGGTYSDVPKGELRLAFSQCLFGLLSVVAQDLAVTISQIKDESTIKQVSAGSYPQSMDNVAGSVTVTFGDLYIQEVRKVLVDLHLPASRKKHGADILKASYTYMFDGELFEASPEIVTVLRKSGSRAEEQQPLPEVRAEEVRLLIAEAIKQAATIADKEDLKSAQDKLANGLLKLEDADIEKLKSELRPELEELSTLIQTPFYERQGRPFAYSLLISLSTQRHMTRGIHNFTTRIFATHAMQEFLVKDYCYIQDHPFKMSFNDDDPIVLPPGTTRPTVPGRVHLVIRNNEKAPLEENIQKVMLEYVGEEKSRPGLDIVVVLEVSHIMVGLKLAELKTAMLLLINKLSAVDRLSIVKYSSNAERLCPLRQMTESTQTELQNLINNLDPWGHMNITDGLEIALNILKDRSVSSGRVGAILLLSGHEEDRGNAAAVPIGNVPVHTFGFGNSHDPEVLRAIANNSVGGTYSDVRMDNMILAFSQCLGGLLNVVAQDLTVTISQIHDESTIKKVSAGSYVQSMDNAAGSVTITFGDIYIQEIRKVLVDLHLPATTKEQDTDVLEVSYTYKFNGELFEASPKTVTVCRMSGLRAEEQQTHPEVRAEEVRLLIAEEIKQATADADKEDLKSAKDMLVNGLKTLGNADIEMLKAELEELLELMKTPSIYKNQGRSFAYSLIVSLDTQRQMARGYNIGKFQLFATPAMQKFLVEAKKFHDTMSLKFNDDDCTVLPADSGTIRPTLPGRVQIVIRNNKKAPLEENIQKVMLELTGEEKGRSGLDLVLVIDVANRSDKEKFAELKKAIQFLIMKLSVVDRLSIVKYSNYAERQCPLRQMTESTRTELLNLINLGNASWDKNITDGLLMALKVLEDRSASSERVGAIMLLSSDGEETIGDAAAVPVGNVPVHTFGFGKGHNLELLKAIANNSLGGTYSDVCMDNMTLAISQSLCGLLSVVAQDLTVTINHIKDESTIKQVSTGNYPQSMDNAAASVTIRFGDIYIQEVRKVLVDLHLPDIKKEQSANVLEVSYTYMFGGELIEANPVTVTVCRMSGLTAEEQQELPEVRVEEVRLLLAETIKQATTDADKNDIKSAQDKLSNGLLKLHDADIEKLKAELRPELEEMLKLTQTEEIYESRGRPFAYSLLISLATQRQIARGNKISKFQLFSTPAMQEFLEEAKKWHDNFDPYKMIFNDDDPNVLSDSNSPEPETIVSCKVQLVIRNNNKTPLEKNIQKVLLELSGEENSQFVLDIVALLDVSSSMEGDKLRKMKIAMLLLMKNLSINDRLSIVEYSSKAKRLCPLRQMTETSQTKFENLIDDLKALPGTNITDGLETALKVLKDRSVSRGRVGVIMLMSDGEQNQGGDAADVPVGNVPVLTFGFGEDQNPEVLIAIANNSRLGGTYTEVCMDNLNINFSHCLDELQNVVVWDLTVTVTQIKNESTVKRASAGRYLQSIDNAAGSVTITFGTLYIREVRKVLVDILLPSIKEEHEARVLDVSYTYRPSTVTVCRMSELTAEQQQPEPKIIAEEARLLIAEVIKQATSVADKEELKSVRDKLVHSLKTLWDQEKPQNRHMEHRSIRIELERLKAELNKLSELMQSQAINEKQGRSFAYSFLISHFILRGSARGNHDYDLQLFDTPAMREFLEKAKMYDEIDDLHVYIDRFICALESIASTMDKQ